MDASSILKRKTSDRSNWVADEDAKQCGICERNFGLTVRRHHCRACGGVFCAKCCSSKTHLEGGPGHAQRVCSKCLTQQLNKDNTRYEKGLEKEKEQEVQKQKDEEYVTHIYDKIGLVSDIFKWLQGGCDVELLHEPDRKQVRMWLQAEPDSLRYVARESTPDAVQLKHIQKIVLGINKDIKGASVGKSESHLVVTVHFSQPTSRGHHFVSFVCREMVDFEAWVLGLSHITGMMPTWGTPLKPDKSLSKMLSDVHIEKLSVHNISSAVFTAVRKTMLTRRDDIKHHLCVFDGDRGKAWGAMGKGRVRPLLNRNGAVYTTKGEVRNLSGLCIFRACALWELLRDQHLVYDPNYIPSVGKGSEVATKKKQAQKPQLDGPKELRIDISDGNSYTKDEFIAHYRGTGEWETSDVDPAWRPKAGATATTTTPAAPVDTRPAIEAPETCEYDAEDAKAEKEHKKKRKAERKAREAEAAAAGAVLEEEAEEEYDHEAAKAERKRLKKVCYAAVAATVAAASQAAYEEKRAAKRRKKQEKEDKEEEEAAVEEEPKKKKKEKKSKREEVEVEEETTAAEGGEVSTEVMGAVAAAALSLPYVCVLEARKQQASAARASKRSAVAAALVSLLPATAGMEAPAEEEM